jgi:hypothetical protein
MKILRDDYYPGVYFGTGVPPLRVEMSDDIWIISDTSGAHPTLPAPKSTFHQWEPLASTPFKLLRWVRITPGVPAGMEARVA